MFAVMEVAMANMMKYFVEGLETHDAKLIIYVPIAVVIVRIFHGVGGFLGNFFIARVGINVVADLRKELFSNLLYLPNRYYDQHNSGEMVSLLVYNIQQVTGSVTNAVKIGLREGLVVIGLFAYMLYTNWMLTLSFLVITPILGVLASYVSKYFRNLSRRMQDVMGGITHIINEALQGFSLVRSFVGQRHEIERFNQATDQNTKLNTKYERVAALQSPVLHLVIAISLAVILYLILSMWKGSAGEAISYLTAAGLITKPLRALSTINETIQKGLAAAETIFEVVDMAPEPDTGTNQLTVKQGCIKFENVGFCYDENATALKNINLTIKPGQTVALVGSSGSGKTTLTNLLLRFYELNSGDIFIDGQNTKDLTLSSLRQQIALVNQQTILFNDTVAHNIAYGSNPEDVKREDIVQAAKHANAFDFISAQPDGFDALIGEDGSRLSGGQRQRLAVARALYKNAPILILDEATSALDTESEKAIQGALETLQEGRTTLIIAHRLSTIEKADKIIALDQGEIVEMGDHAELLAKGGYYAALHAAQFSQQPPAQS